MNKIYSVSLIVFTVLFFIFGCILLIDYSQVNSGLFTLPNKVIQKTNVIPDQSKLQPPIKADINSNKINKVIVLENSYQTCNNMIENIKNAEKYIPVNCIDYELDKNRYVNKNVKTAYYFKTKYGFLEGCFDFQDTCLGTKVLDKYCGPEVNFDDFESAFYKNVKQEFIDKNSTLDFSSLEVKKAIDELKKYNISELQVKQMISQLIANPKASFIFLGDEKIKEIMRKTIDEKVVLEENLFCFSDSFCSDGQCNYIEKKPLDLYVGKISDSVKSYRCNNTFEFEVCNSGEVELNQDFNIEINANNVIKNFKYYISEFGKILPGKCNLVSNNNLNILFFNLSLNKDIQIKINLDISNDISEIDEKNNEKIGFTNTGDEYYYDTNKICESWCFDSDSDLLDYNSIFNFGSIIYKSNGQINYDSDRCDGLNILELFCVPQYNPGSIVNPESSRRYNCNEEAKESGYDFGYCNENKCEFKNLDDSVNSCVLKNAKASELNIYPFCNYVSTGVIYQKNEDNGEFKETKCLNDKNLIKWNCENTFDTKFAGFIDITCPKVKLTNEVKLDSNIITCNTFCDAQKRSCFYDEKVTQECFDSDNGDYPDIPGYVSIRTIKDINDDGNIYQIISDENINDDCWDYGNFFVERVCSGNNYLEKKYTDLIAQNKGCIYLENNAKIVDLNDNLKSCIDIDDSGRDPNKFGLVEYITNKGEKYSANDFCINNKLSEVYCANNEPKFEIIDCDSGLSCKGGECQ